MLRIVKSLLVAAVGLFALLVALNNVLDYGSNFQFVQHVLSMDSTFPGNALMGRAITAPWAHHAGYALIIATEAATGLLCAWGAWRLLQHRHAPGDQYLQSKTPATAGLTLGILLWFTGFLTVGAEWFLMWQSADWNGQQPAFRFVMVLLGVLIFLHQPEPDPDRALT